MLTTTVSGKVSSPRWPKALVAHPTKSPLIVTFFKDGQRIAFAAIVSTSPLSVRVSNESLTMPFSPMLTVASSVRVFKELLLIPLFFMIIAFPSTVRFSNALLTIPDGSMVSFSVAFSSIFFNVSLLSAFEFIVIDFASMVIFSTTDPTSILEYAEKFFSPDAIFRFFIFVSLNALPPIEVSWSENSRISSDEQPINALLPIELRFKNSRLSSDEQFRNASSPIELRFSGILMLLRFSQPSKAPARI